MGRTGGAGTQETLNVAGLMDLQLGCIADSGQEGRLGGRQKDFKQLIGALVGGLAFLFSLVEEVGHIRVHGGEELVNSLHFEAGSAVEERGAVLGVFELLFAVKTSAMVGNMFSSHEDFQVVGIGEDLRGGGGVGGRDGVAVGIQLDKGGFTDLRQDDPVGAVRDFR